MAGKKQQGQPEEVWYTCTTKCYHAGKLWHKGDRATEQRILSQDRKGNPWIPPYFVKEA